MSNTTNTTVGRPLSKNGKQAKKKVLSFLDSNEPFTAKDISKAGKVKVSHVRNHLNFLERNGIIQKVDRKRGKRGRPHNLYIKSETE